MLDKFNSVLQEFKDKQEQLHSMFEDTLKEVIEEFLNTHLDIVAVKWIGYVPYFNDGEPCIFSINSFNVISNEVLTEENFDTYIDLELDAIYYKGYDKYDLKDWDNDIKQYVDSKGKESLLEDITNLEQFLDNNKTLIQYLFGDHHKVVITREAITVEAYTDHD